MPIIGVAAATGPSYDHPYEPEIRSFEPSSDQLGPCEVIPYLNVNTTEAMWIDTEEALTDMIDELCTCK